MFHPESNPLAPKSSGPKKPEKELVEIWLGKEAAAEMDEGKPETRDDDLNSKKHELTEQEKKTLWEMKRPDEVTLRNIPKWEELPEEETFKRDFKFDWFWKHEYRKGRSIEEFETQNMTETLPIAKIFEIGNVITKARKKDPEHPDYLTTAEVLEVIDAAGYRPATLEELVAYARDYWKPGVDPKTLTKEERELQDVQARYIVALNSVFSDSDGDRNVSRLVWGAGRGLNGGTLGDDWNANYRFLVLRKALPT